MFVSEEMARKYHFMRRQYNQPKHGTNSPTVNLSPVAIGVKAYIMRLYAGFR